MAVLGVGIVAALAVIAALLGLLHAERKAALDQARDRGEMLLRVLEDHTRRAFDSGALVLATLGESLSRRGTLHDDPALPQTFSNALLGLNHIRSLALLDEQGRVIASSDASDLGLKLGAEEMAVLRRATEVQLPQLLAGRGLRDMVEGGARQVPEGVAILPMARALRGGDGRAYLLVLLLSPDAFANYQQRVLADIPGQVWMASYDGRLLAATQQVQQTPGQPLTAHPVFVGRLHERQYGAYDGQGLQPGVQLVAYRVLADRPVVLAVEQDRDAVLATWRAALRWKLGVVALILLAIGAGTAVVRRSLASRQRARAALDRAHEAVALRERELSVLMKSVQELIFRTDEQGRLSFTNARWSIYDRSGGARLIGRKLSELVESAYERRVAALFSRSGDALGIRATEAVLRLSDGSPRRLAISVVPLQSQGQIVGFAGSAIDTTERHATQQRLRQELAFTTLLLDVSPQPIVLFDAKGRYATVNRAWEQFTGLPRDRVIGARMASFMDAADRALHERLHEKLLAEGGTLRYEASWPHCDGSRREVQITKVLLRDELGAVTGSLSTLLDISEFRDAERATREARDAAEEASRAKSEFIANISHELRTPLQSILGFSELGQARALAQPKLASMFGDIHASGQRMLALVNDLLDVSKIESSVGSLELQRCDLRELVRSVLHELAPLADRRRVQLLPRLPQEPLAAKVDPLRFQQVLRNVVANAIKFSPDGGVIEIEAQLAAHGDIRLSVADHGPGIPPAELESIFEAFVQSSQTKDGSGGTGLGLAICRKIVEIHGGRIRASNRAGGGAVFEITLPSPLPGDTRPLDMLTTLPATLPIA